MDEREGWEREVHGRNLSLTARGRKIKGWHEKGLRYAYVDFGLGRT